MEDHNYWTRRGFLRLAAGAVGIALIGCSADDDASQTGGPTAAAGFSTPTPQGSNASTEEVKTGGTWKAYINGEPPNLDSFTNSSLVSKGVGLYAYNRLYHIPAQPGVNPFDVSPEGDLAESAETADGITWTVTLKKGVKTQSIAPLNGREMNAQDVAYSFERLQAPESLFASAVEHVTSVEVVDDYTLRFSHDAPNADFLDLMADGAVWLVQPVETADGFDPKERMIGAGPWILDDYQVGSKFTFRRNPDWYGSPRPYMDGVELYVIPEYTNALAQFQARSLHTMTIQAADVLNVIRDMPGVQWDQGTGGGMYGLYFAPVETHPDAPWQDVRFRRALSMSINRDEFMRFLYNHDALTAAGLPVVTRWNNLVSNGLGDRWWLDPQSAAQGPSAEYFQYDPGEATKLIQAGGWDGGEPIQFAFTPRYGNVYTSAVEALHGYFQAIGVNSRLESQDYSSIYVSQTWQGRHDGMALGAYGGFTSVSGYLSEMIGDNPSNLRLVHTPDILDLLQRQAREIDLDARVELVHELQRVNAENMYIVPTTGSGAAVYYAYQPEVRGGLRWTRGQGGAMEITTNYWLDV